MTAKQRDRVARMAKVDALAGARRNAAEWGERAAGPIRLAAAGDDFWAGTAAVYARFAWREALRVHRLMGVCSRRGVVGRLDLDGSRFVVCEDCARIDPMPGVLVAGVAGVEVGEQVCDDCGRELPAME